MVIINIEYLIGGKYMFEFLIDDHSYSHIHFIGIGGVSMSGLAEILITQGFKVSGSDSKESHILNRLMKLGASIYIGHKKENIQNADLIIYTDAISKDNIELATAIESGAQLVDRATFLGALMKNYSNSIAVSGTHGKTTTTSMIASITKGLDLNPTMLIGGNLNEIGGNVRLGSRDYILTEACEYKANILKYYPTMAIILNMDEDHLDYFKDMNHIIETFKGYVSNLREEDDLIINIDDENASKIIENSKAKVITFGVNKKADYTAEYISFSDNGLATFTLNIRDKEFYPVKLDVMGTHNVYNAIAAIAATHNLGVPIDVIIENILHYKGVNRRLEVKGYYNDIQVLDDYAHHPTEIRACLQAVKQNASGNIYCIFQPHTFTRTKILLDSFSKSFKDADKVIITDIYAAREIDNGEIHSRDLANAVRKTGTDCIYISTFEEIEDYLLKNAQANDIILTMGAGNIFTLGESILAHANDEKKQAV